jgi:hypothetical protein
MDEIVDSIIALLRRLGSDEVAGIVADTQQAYLLALMSRGFTREEAMQLLLRGNLLPNTSK